MEHLSDQALHAIAYSVELPEHGRLRDELSALNEAGTLTPQQQTQLRTLQAESEALMVRKAHAFVLLKRRGHTLPPISQLPVPSA